MGESEERFSTIFRSSPVAIILSRLEDGRLVDINPASLKLLGYTREDLMDRTSLEAGIWCVPEYRNRLVEIMRARGRVEDVEIEFRKKSGETGTILGSAELISLAGVDHLLNMGIDITDRKRAEEAIHSSRLKLTEAMDLARVVQWEVDLTTKELVLNDAYYALYGTTAEQEGGYRIPGEDYVKRFVHPDDWWTFKQAAERRLINGESEFIEDSKHRIVRRDGEVRTIIARVHVSKDRAGRLIRYYGANQDITERKRAEEKLESALKNLRKAIGGTIEAIIQVVEMRDPYTAGHQRRVAHLARAMATEMGLPFDMIEGIRMAAVIHDIGKVSVPAEILSKPGKLTEKEFELVKDHTVTGYDILKDLEFPWPIAEIIYQHHEKLDGSGYPRGLKGDEVRMEARIIAVADVVEAMASHRPSLDPPWECTRPWMRSKPTGAASTIRMRSIPA
jgi:PAS domain S-box-containing protein/putative nucleotidyltransferase with HDIG domain